MGDAAGIGPEIVAKVAAKGFLEEWARPILIGDRTVLERGMRDTGCSFPYKAVEAIEEALKTEGLILIDTHSRNAADVEIGRVSVENGKEEGDLLVDCIRYCQAGLIDGFCFAPLNKGAMKLGGYHFDSEHEMFAHYFGVKDHFGEMNVLGDLWNIRVTSHIPLKDVCANLTVPKIMETLELGFTTLKRAGIESPRLAMAAVNPHGGDSGTCGREEIEILAPAVELARKQGKNVMGPFPCDTLFLRAFKGEFDGVVTMYHDQGQIAIKLKGFEHTVTVSTGLPNAVTTPAHGTAYDIAGTGKCVTSTFEDAYRIAAKMAASDRTERQKK